MASAANATGSAVDNGQAFIVGSLYFPNINPDSIDCARPARFNLAISVARVAASGALDRSRELALHYASDARSRLDGVPRREELEALTRAVVERRS